MAKLVLLPEEPIAQRFVQRCIERLKHEWPKPGGFFHTFAGESVDLHGELERRMKPRSTERKLRRACSDRRSNRTSGS